LHNNINRPILYLSLENKPKDLYLESNHKSSLNQSNWLKKWLDGGGGNALILGTALPKQRSFIPHWKSLLDLATETPLQQIRHCDPPSNDSTKNV
jgi:hypothetical protein